MSLYQLIVTAYGIKSFQVSGPNWMKSQRFDIAAKIPESLSKDRVPEMVPAASPVSWLSIRINRIFKTKLPQHSSCRIGGMEMHHVRQEDLPFVGSVHKFVGADQGDTGVSSSCSTGARFRSRSASASL